MLISRRSQISGKIQQMEIPVTEEQIIDWQHGDKLIQNALPNLTAEQREFLITGITPEEWKATFGEEE